MAQADERYYLKALDLLVVCIVFLLIHLVWNRNRRPLPPGPPGIPLVGSIFSFPKEQAWLVYRNLAVQYGDVVALNALGQTLIVLNSVTAAIELLDERSVIYSDRQESTLSNMIGWDWNFVLKSYGHDWRRLRRMFWKHFRPDVVAKYQPAQQREARAFLRRLLDGQEDLDGQLKLTVSKTILTAVHGIPREEATQHFVDILTAAEEGIAEAFTPGAFLVEFFPWLRYVPTWVPGTGWQRRIPDWQAQVVAIREEPFEASMHARRRGVAEPSVMSDLLDATTDMHDLRDIQDMTAAAFAAGTDTTAATLVGFFCAMILHPEVQTKAQAELDSIVGRERLPEHADRATLPYVNAVVKELLRWHNVVPLGVAHRCMEEDEYRGWRIPKGAIILPNTWAMLHDPEVYPEPEVFRPERFLKEGQLDPDVLDPASVTFGFGRRICPGRHFADDALFITVASVLHAFNIVPALDEAGQPIPVEAKMTSGFTSYLEKFEYVARPRSESATALIRGA